MAEFKNEIRLGVSIDSQGAQSKLEEVIKTLNANKINLDVNIKDSNVTRQLETLTDLAKNFKEALGGNISLGNIDKVVGETTSSMEKLNGELLKTTEVRFNNGTISKQMTETADGIGTVVKQIKSLQDGSIVEGQQTIVTNNAKIKQSIEDIANAQKRLSELESNGSVNQNKVADLKNMFSSPENFSSDNELKSYLNQVKELENEEKNNVQLANQIQDAWDKSYQQRVNAEQKAMEQIEANEKKSSEQEILRLGEQCIAQQKAEQNLINQMANGREKTEVKTQQVNRNEELTQANAINKALEEEYNLQQKIKQSQINERINTLETNGIVSDSEISKLRELTSNITKLSELKNILSTLGQSESRETTISNLSKQIDQLESKLQQMKQTFGSNLSGNFISSTESSISKLKEDLKSVDGVNFNGIKNSLNSVKSEMNQVTNETKQMISASNNGGFFSGISNFLGKIGVFYGVQQVVQGISEQLRNAGQYAITMDKSFTNMQMITGESKETISGLVNEYKELGAQLHTTNTEMMGGMEEIQRAGIEGEEGKSLMSSSIMGSKISGQTTEEVTQQLIAIKNAFNMTGQDMQGVVDMISKMDNVSATSFKEIASAIQRTAYSAQEAGTPLSNLVAYITTVSEKTRKSAETIGESFKTIYARYSNIKLGNIDEDGKTINDTETAMNRIGISIRSSKGEFKEFDTVLQEFMQKYKSGQLSQIDYLAGVQALAGTRKQKASYVQKCA